MEVEVEKVGGGKGGMSIKEVITYVVNQLHT